LRNVWKIAAEAVKMADVISFIGYSLPSYDLDAVELFRDCARATRVNVIAKGMASNMRQRYATITGGTPEFYDMTFAQMLDENPDAIA
jgi:hypothetical protein